MELTSNLATVLGIILGLIIVASVSYALFAADLRTLRRLREENRKAKDRFEQTLRASRIQG